MPAGQTVLMTGATGMVGQQVLDQLLSRSDVAFVRTIGRRPTGVVDDKLIETKHDDFLDFSGQSDVFEAVDLCIYCLGVYQSAVSKEQFFEITCAYQQAFTDQLAAASRDATFVLFGAQGADPSERSWTTFANAKGRAEKLLQETPFPQKYIFRPGYIFPTGRRQPQNLGYKVFAVIAGLSRSIGINFGITDQELAGAMVKVGMRAEMPSRVFEQSDIRKL